MDWVFYVIVVLVAASAGAFVGYHIGRAVGFDAGLQRMVSAFSPRR